MRLGQKSFYVRVYFEDTDCGGIVYHTNYIKYCERARSEMFYQSGMLPVSGSSGFVLTHINASFKKSAYLGDLLEIKTSLKELKNASVIITQEIYRIQSLYTQNPSNLFQNLEMAHNTQGISQEELEEEHKAKSLNEKLFSAEITLAFVDVARGRPMKIPAHFIEIFQHSKER